MKDFIVALALFTLLMWFPSQDVAQQINHSKVIAYNSIVDKHAQTARIAGCFTAVNITALKEELASALYINIGEITVIADTSPKSRTDSFNQMQMIHFKVSVPIKKFLAMNTFFGVSDAANQITYTYENEIPSELLVSN